LCQGCARRSTHDPRHAAAQTSLKHTHELVCLAMEPGCTAVGSQSHVTLLDPRKKGPAQYIRNIQGNCVRSFAIHTASAVCALEPAPTWRAKMCIALTGL